MPTYEYKCEACNATVEKFQSMSAAPLRKCPECGQNRLRRMIGTGAGVIFKGSGFYATDYRSESYKSAAKAETSSGGNGKTDATPKPSAESSKGSSAVDKPAATKSEPAKSK